MEQIFHEKELCIFGNLRIPDAQATSRLSFTPQLALTTDYLDAYDSDCEKPKHSKVALERIYLIMVMSSSKQSNVVNHSETEITSDSNIIPYSQYVIESQQAAVQNSNSSAQQDALILSVIEQLKTQVANCTKINLENKSVNDTLTAELERYKEQVKNSVNSLEPILSIRPTVVEVPKELPKVSIVNTSLKKLKHHLAGFDVVVKERTTPTAIIKGLWGIKKPSTSASGSQPSGNTKKDKIQQTPSSTQKNKHSKRNVNSELKCVKCNGCMLSDNNDLCVLDYINNVNARTKSKHVKKSSKRKV
ncbi:hypothetical protein Tco_0686611 [Tanacetum coccineum]